MSVLDNNREALKNAILQNLKQSIVIETPITPSNNSNSNTNIIEECSTPNTPLQSIDVMPKEFKGKQIESLPTSILKNAPAEWNVFPEYDVSKMIGLITSILKTGLHHPLVIWQQLDKSYMILSGHNRKSAYELIYDIFKDENYLEIPVIIYKYEELNENSAQDIIDDLNIEQRENSKKIIAQCIIRKYNRIKNDSSEKGKTREIVAKKLENIGLTGRMVDYYVDINKLIPELQQLIYDDVISLKNSTKLKNLSQDMQQWFYENYKNDINNKLINKFKKVMTKNDIENLYNSTNENTTITLEIPVDLKDSFLEIYKKFIEENK